MNEPATTIEKVPEPTVREIPVPKGRPAPPPRVMRWRIDRHPVTREMQYLTPEYEEQPAALPATPREK